VTRRLRGAAVGLQLRALKERHQEGEDPAEDGRKDQGTGPDVREPTPR
jgi:hypothetical protein